MNNDGTLRDSFESRDAALAVLREFGQRILRAQTCADVSHAVLRARDMLVRIQGARSEARYLAKSVCRMSVALRRILRPELALELLEWVVCRGVIDCYIVSEVVQCRLAGGESGAAINGLRRACDSGQRPEALYPALLAFYTHQSDVNRAQAVVDGAARSGCLNVSMLVMFLETCGRARNAAAAERVVEQARAAGMFDAADARTYAAMMGAYADPIQAKTARRVFDRASL